jgi:hypothetical protein
VSKKPKKTSLPQVSPSGIRLTELKSPEGISFSFKYYDPNHDKFNCNEKSGFYWQALANRLKDLSALTAPELRQSGNKTLRFHSIDWARVSEINFGLKGEEQLVDIPYQFSISANEHGRVHGFFIGEVFYIVWLDPEHLLYYAK